MKKLLLALLLASFALPAQAQLVDAETCDRDIINKITITLEIRADSAGAAVAYAPGNIRVIHADTSMVDGRQQVTACKPRRSGDLNGILQSRNLNALRMQIKGVLDDLYTAATGGG